MKKSPYKAVFLDLDHTLCDTDSADRAGEAFLGQLFEHLKLGSEEVCSRAARTFMIFLYKGSDSIQRLEDETENTYRARLMQQALFQEIGVRCLISDCEDWVVAVMNHRIESLEFFDGVVEMFERLRKTYTLVIITNGPLYSQRPKVEKLNVDRYVDHLILCGAYPWQKPDPRIFEEAMSLTSCEPNEVIHVGDSLGSDILGANNAGIDSVWVSSDLILSESDPKPTYSISHITELENLL